MNKEQFSGLLRELLTAVGAALVTWGISSAGMWQEITGLIMAAVGIGWAWSHHEDKGLKLSAVRKLISAGAGVAVASGVMSPEKVEVLLGVTGSLVTLVWSMWDKGGTPPSATPLLLLAALMFTSCGGQMRITEDGCILGSYVRDGRTYWAGPCAGTDGKIDRVRTEWESPQDGGGVMRFRATIYADRRKTLLEYQLAGESAGDGGPWIRWSAKSGLVIGDMPQEVAKSLEEAPKAAVVTESTK